MGLASFVQTAKRSIHHVQAGRPCTERRHSEFYQRQSRGNLIWLHRRMTQESLMNPKQQIAYHLRETGHLLDEVSLVVQRSDSEWFVS